MQAKLMHFLDLFAAGMIAGFQTQFSLDGHTDRPLQNGHENVHGAEKAL